MWGNLSPIKFTSKGSKKKTLAYGHFQKSDYNVEGEATFDGKTLTIIP